MIDWKKNDWKHWGADETKVDPGHAQGSILLHWAIYALTAILVIKFVMDVLPQID
jgi:hypothetical protein